MRLAVLLAFAMLAVGGCKSTGQTEEAAVRDHGVDRDRMSQVEQQAQRSGVRVHWVNPPQKPAR